MNSYRGDNKSFLIVAFVVLLSRIPFLFSGFGSEEDAWGLILTARNISASGIYEVSRMPGHPVQEYLLSLIWDWPFWILNLLTAIISTLGVYFFMLTIARLGSTYVFQPGNTSIDTQAKTFFSNPVIGGIAFAFTPVFYIHATNVMDYTWALSLVSIALYLTVTGRYLWAGIVIGIACGFRVTAGAMAIPFAAWHYFHYRSVKLILASGFLTFITAVVCFIPAYNAYGSGFFTYYEYFPYPPLFKNIYKGTIGAWGLPGTIAVIGGMILVIYRWLRTAPGVRKQLLPLVVLCSTTIVLYTYSFLKIPQKTAFVLPMVPFVILLMAHFLTKKEFLIFTSALILSCFSFGINLDDPFRGSKASVLSVKAYIGNTPVAIDVLSGLVLADHSKRVAKMNYAESVVQQLSGTTEKTAIIAGFWQNELKYYSLLHNNPLVTYYYYVDRSGLQKLAASGYAIYFLPEQNYFNDLRFRGQFTDDLADPFNIYKF